MIEGSRQSLYPPKLEALSVDVGYVHIWIDDSEVVDTFAPGAALVGTYEGEVDIVSLQLTWAI